MEANRPTPYLAVDPEIPGIGSLFAFRPETAAPMRALAQQLLRGPSPLSEGERELIAAYVSRRNECHFCMSSHAGAASALLKQPYRDLVDSLADLATSDSVPAKMRTLLAIAGAVQRSGRDVTPDHIAAARAAGATDLEIHDTVLVAAAFCMYNRYVDGLAAATPDAPEVYAMMGERLAERGYAPAAAPPDNRNDGTAQAR